MPGVARKVLILAAVDGLILQPLSQRSGPSVKVDYKTSAVSPAIRTASNGGEDDKGLEVHGIIGLLKLSTSSYLLAILRRKQVAQLWGHPIFSISDIAVIPVTSQTDAKSAIHLARQSSGDNDESHNGHFGDGHADAENDALVGLDDTWLDKHIASLGQQPHSQHERKPSVAQDVIGRKGAYGRFADKWFSTHGWLHGSRRNMGMSSGDDMSTKTTPDTPPERSISTNTDTNEGPLADGIPNANPSSQTLKQNSEAPTNFVPKLLQTTKLLLASGTFFFSHDIDLTHRFSNQFTPSSNVALCKQADPAYFWNKHLATPLIGHGCDDIVLPVLQGFIGQREFSVESKLASSSQDKEASIASEERAVESLEDSVSPNSEQNKTASFLLTIVSRRSAKRSGLRYLRRGIDEDGNTANAVETEQILSTSSWDPDKPIQSFVQIRGSIPLFFTQLPYTFKPPAVLHGSVEANRQAFKKHFSDLISRYGSVQAISLVDRQGVETTIGDAYENSAARYNETFDPSKKINFEWFNFHQACRGMKFENVSILVESMTNFLNTHGWTTLNSASNGSSASLTSVGKQTGIIRTNCMDCLDRTNVVQSAFGQFILEQQLKHLGYPIDLAGDPNTTWFNTVWADNGDAISRSYAGTSALKGDYTRTRKRNMYGMLTDFSLTLTRYYLNLFNDFFAQAAIDYLLGNVTEQVFAEFQTKMTSVDPAIDLRKARDGAIQLAATTIIDENEDLQSGWALAVPAMPNTLRTFPFEEALLLLTNASIYSVRYDWDAEKVKSFERVSLRSIVSVQKGAYITETLAESQTDPDTNVGIVTRYKTEQGRPGLVRINTRTLVTTSTGFVDNTEPKSSGDKHSEPQTETRVLAFKALPQGSAIVRPSSHTSELSEKQLVDTICREISVAAANLTKSDSTDATGGEARTLKVDETPIVSLAEAKRGTSLVDYVGYNLKKLVWG